MVENSSLDVLGQSGVSLLSKQLLSIQHGREVIALGSTRRMIETQTDLDGCL